MNEHFEEGQEQEQEYVEWLRARSRCTRRYRELTPGDLLVVVRCVLIQGCMRQVIRRHNEANPREPINEGQAYEKARQLKAYIRSRGGEVEHNN